MSQRLLDPRDARCFAIVGAFEAALFGAAWVTGAPLLAGWLLGLLGWTFLEYLLHRLLFHVERTSALAALGARHHADHHAAPSALPITKPPALTLGAFGAGLAVAVGVFGAAAVPAFAGLVAGYLLYEVAHVAIHVLDDAQHPIPAFRQHHLLHHAEPGQRFGISSPLWDHVFRSI